MLWRLAIFFSYSVTPFTLSGNERYLFFTIHPLLTICYIFACWIWVHVFCDFRPLNDTSVGPLYRIHHTFRNNSLLIGYFLFPVRTYLRGSLSLFREFYNYWIWVILSCILLFIMINLGYVYTNRMKALPDLSIAAGSLNVLEDIRRKHWKVKALGHHNQRN